MKKGRLSKIEKFYIQQNLCDLSQTELSSDLDRSEKTIAKYIASLESAQEATEVEQPTSTTKREGPIDRLVGKKRGATVYTKAAAEYADGTRDTRVNKDVSTTRYTEDCIHRPKG